MHHQARKSRPVSSARERFAVLGPVLLALVLVLIVALLGLTRRAAAQDIEESLTGLGAENARRWVHPLVAGLGAGLNAGFFHGATVHAPLGFDISVRGMGAFAPASAGSFEPVLPEEVTYAGKTYTDPFGSATGVSASPTALGAGPGVLIGPQGEFREDLIAAGEDPDRWTRRFPEGLDIPAVPAAVAQVTLGLPLGTEVAYRFVPTLDLGDDVGRVSLRGFGVNHSVDQWFPAPWPVRVAVSAGWQRLEAGDYLTLEARQASVVVGQDLGLLVLYGALGLESTVADVDYLVRNDSGNPGLPEGGTRIAFEDEGENSGRAVAGITLDLPLLKLNAEYTRAAYRVVNAKLILGIW